MQSELYGEAHIWQRLAVGVLAGGGAIAAFSLRRRPPRTISTFGTAALAVIFLVSYLAFGVPTVIAGALVPGLGLGLSTVAYGYGALRR